MECLLEENANTNILKRMMNVVPLEDLQRNLIWLGENFEIEHDLM